MESKVRWFVFNLEKLNKNNYFYLEYRPWPTSYHLGNKVQDGYEMDDTIYIGLRVRNISVIKETYS